MVGEGLNGSKRGGESEGGDKGGEGEWEGKIIHQVNQK